MQLFTHVICYALFTISVMTAFISPDGNNEMLTTDEERMPNQINRRDIMLIDDITKYDDRSVQKTPMVMYLKKSKKRFSMVNPTYSHPLLADIELKRESSKIPLKRFSTNRNKPKYRPSISKQTQHIWQKKQKRGRFQSNSKPPLSQKHFRRPVDHEGIDPAGFGEPPTEYKTENSFPHKVLTQDSYDPFVHHNSNPSIDSYNEAIKSRIKPIILDEYGDYYDSNTMAAKTVKQSFKNHPEYEIDDTFPHDVRVADGLGIKKDELDDEQSIISNSDIHLKSVSVPVSMQKRKKVYNHGRHKLVYVHPAMRKPWKAIGTAEMVVGGQYAEPPARVVSRIQPSSPLVLENSDFSIPWGGSDSFDTEHSQISPYVNYKHSNLAFSPQNLNDAFSIVFK